MYQSFDQGYLSPYFINSRETATANLDQPYVLLYPKKIANILPLLPLLELVARYSRTLLIVADVEGEALAMLVAYNVQGIMKNCAVKAPGSSESDRAKSLEQLAEATRGQVIAEETGLTLENTELLHLGQAGYAVVSSDRTQLSDSPISVAGIPPLV